MLSGADTALRHRAAPISALHRPLSYPSDPLF